MSDQLEACHIAVGLRIRMIRDALGIEQVELAKRAGMSRVHREHRDGASAPFPPHCGNIGSRPRNIPQGAHERSLVVNVTLPPGWRAVPEEPTEEMLGQGAGLTDFILPKAIDNGASAHKREMAIAWRAMLAAAPPPPASDVADALDALLDVLTIDCGHIQTMRFASLDKSRAVYQRARAALSKYREKNNG